MFLGNALDGFLDAWIGICGVVLGIAVGSKLWNRGLKIRTQLENLPTSTVHGAAMGLAEFKGVARSLKDKRQQQAKTGGAGTSTDRGLIKNRSFSRGSTQAARVKRQLIQSIRNSFWRMQPGASLLILKEPNSGTVPGISSGVQSALFTLKRRFSVDAKNIHTRMLLPGDPVYLIGTVEENPEAPKDALDEDRLVVRPSQSLVQSGFLQRLMFGGRRENERQ